MKLTDLLIKTLIISLGCFSTSLVSAETTEYTGTVTGFPVKHLMPLGNGDAVLTLQSSGILALSGNPPTIHTMTCSGLGYQTAENNTTTDFYCNIKESDDDSFDIKGSAKEAGEDFDGSFEVIGGNGKWNGATGKGKFIRYDKMDTANKMFLELKINTP